MAGDPSGSCRSCRLGLLCHCIDGGQHPDSGLPGLRLPPLDPQLLAPTELDLTLRVRTELPDQGLGAPAVAQLFVAIAGAPRVRDATPDRPGTSGVPRKHTSHREPPCRLICLVAVVAATRYLPAFRPLCTCDTARKRLAVAAGFSIRQVRSRGTAPRRTRRRRRPRAPARRYPGRTDRRAGQPRFAGSPLGLLSELADEPTYLLHACSAAGTPSTERNRRITRMGHLWDCWGAPWAGRPHFRGGQSRGLAMNHSTNSAHRSSSSKRSVHRFQKKSPSA